VRAGGEAGGEEREVSVIYGLARRRETNEQRENEKERRRKRWNEGKEAR